MHIWGSIVMHPLTYPIADQMMALIGMSCKYTVAVYGAVLQPTVEDFKFLFDQIS